MHQKQPRIFNTHLDALSSYLPACCPETKGRGGRQANRDPLKDLLQTKVGYYATVARVKHRHQRYLPSSWWHSMIRLFMLYLTGGDRRNTRDRHPTAPLFYGCFYGCFFGNRSSRRKMLPKSVPYCRAEPFKVPAAAPRPRKRVGATQYAGYGCTQGVTTYDRTS